MTKQVDDPQQIPTSINHGINPQPGRKTTILQI